MAQTALFFPSDVNLKVTSVTSSIVESWYFRQVNQEWIFGSVWYVMVISKELSQMSLLLGKFCSGSLESQARWGYSFALFLTNWNSSLFQKYLIICNGHLVFSEKNFRFSGQEYFLATGRIEGLFLHLTIFFLIWGLTKINCSYFFFV